MGSHSHRHTVCGYLTLYLKKKKEEEKKNERKKGRN
jgi:ribosomal protein S17E